MSNEKASTKFLHVLALRPDGRREPVATVAYRVDDAGGAVTAACALRSRRDQFQRARGRTIAEGRLNTGGDHSPTFTLAEFDAVRGELVAARHKKTSYGRARATLARFFRFDVRG